MYSLSIKWYHFPKLDFQKQNANLLISFGLKGRQKTRDMAARQLTKGQLISEANFKVFI